MSRPIELVLPNGHRIVVELCEQYKEVRIYISDEDNAAVQDLAIIRGKTDGEPGAEILIYSDPNNEDYTHKFDIDEYEEFPYDGMDIHCPQCGKNIKVMWNDARCDDCGWHCSDSELDDILEIAKDDCDDNK